MEEGIRINTDLMFSSETDQWETPQNFFNEVDKEFHFELDVCALPENTKCKNYYTPEKDGLKQLWSGVCWMNPPYGREIGKWVKKAYETVNSAEREREREYCSLFITC